MRLPRLPALLLVLGATLLAPVACASNNPSEPDLGEPDLWILFVGNSLTSANNLPAVMSTVAEAAGLDVATQVVALPNFSLEDHWAQGMENFIRTARPDVVVMQQGPSSLPESQLHLQEWTDSLSRVSREVGAEPAILMVWPTPDRRTAFDHVRDSYRTAALAAGGTFVPAGEALRALLERDSPDVAPFSGDGFHPSGVGTVTTALVLLNTLFDRPAANLPREMPAGARGGVEITLTESMAETLFFVADSVAAAWRETGS